MKDNSNTTSKESHAEGKSEINQQRPTALGSPTCSASSFGSGGMIPWKFTDDEKKEVIEYLHTREPQRQNSTVILDKSDVPEDLLGEIFFADRDEEEIETSSRQYLSQIRQYMAHYRANKGQKDQ